MRETYIIICYNSEGSIHVEKKFGTREDIQDYLMDEGNEYFTADDIEGAYYLGYADLTTDLLLRWGIDHETLDVEYDEDDNVICDDIVYG